MLDDGYVTFAHGLCQCLCQTAERDIDQTTIYCIREDHLGAQCEDVCDCNSQCCGFQPRNITSTAQSSQTTCLTAHEWVVVKIHL